MIREAAEHYEVKKIALRQSKDGVVVSFVIHPNDLSKELTLATLGQRYLMALVPLSDDNEPEPNVQSLEDLPVRRAAILCKDPRFQKYLEETNSAWKIMNEGSPAERAAELVRVYCSVKSRKDIIPGTPAHEKWEQLRGRYEAWLRS